jgi:hypothetical protein
MTTAGTDRRSRRAACATGAGQDIETTIWEAGTENGISTYAFETRVGTDVVLKDGLAEVADR